MVLKIGQIINPEADKNVLAGKYAVRVGTCAPKGSKFTIGKSTIEIGPTHIYEIDLLGHGHITDLKFVSKSNDDDVIIDFIYEEVS